MLEADFAHRSTSIGIGTQRRIRENIDKAAERNRGSSDERGKMLPRWGKVPVEGWFVQQLYLLVFEKPGLRGSGLYARGGVTKLVRVGVALVGEVLHY